MDTASTAARSTAVCCEMSTRVAPRARPSGHPGPPCGSAPARCALSLLWLSQNVGGRHRLRLPVHHLGHRRIDATGVVLPGPGHHRHRADAQLPRSATCAARTRPRCASARCWTTSPARRLVEIPVDDTGFEIPDQFVVGDRLDDGERYRNLRFSWACCAPRCTRPPNDALPVPGRRAPAGAARRHRRDRRPSACRGTRWAATAACRRSSLPGLRPIPSASRSPCVPAPARWHSAALPYAMGPQARRARPRPWPGCSPWPPLVGVVLWVWAVLPAPQARRRRARTATGSPPSGRSCSAGRPSRSRRSLPIAGPSCSPLWPGPARRSRSVGLAPASSGMVRRWRCRRCSR